MNTTDVAGSQEGTQSRKREHLELALKSKLSPDLRLRQCAYEPLFGPHPNADTHFATTSFLGKKMKLPLWISSMTGGTAQAGEINQNLARVAGEFGLGMGLGSIRPLLDSRRYFSHFDLRGLLGEEVPFFANLGICQIEQLLKRQSLSKVHDLVEELRCDGLIIHINVLQEWFQPGGDRLEKSALENITAALEEAPYPIIVKEVGQGMGPRSLAALMKLPLGAIEFGAFGGTNFSLLEIIRSDSSVEGDKEFARLGHTAEEMVEFVRQITLVERQDEIKCRNFIISGGITSMLQGYILSSRCPGTAIIGRAGAFLERGRESYEQLKNFVLREREALSLAMSFVDSSSAGEEVH